MDNPYNIFLKSEAQNENVEQSNPYSKFLNAADRNETSLKTSNEDPIIDFTKPYEVGDDANPYAKFLNLGEFGKGTKEDVDLSKKVANAFKLGLLDTARGVNQIKGGKILGLGSTVEELREQQKKLYEDFDGDGGYLVAAAYFGGAILDPAGWLLPVTKARTLYKLAKYGFVTSGLTGALGYVDEDSILDTRAKQAGASAVGGAILTPLIGAGVKKIKGEKIELGLPGVRDPQKDIDITVKAAAENNLHRSKLLNEAGQNQRDVIYRDKFETPEPERLKDTPSDKGRMVAPVRKFYKKYTDWWESKVGRPLYEQISQDKQVTIPGTQIPIRGLYGSEAGTGAISGTLAYGSAEDDATQMSKMGRFAIGFMAGAGGIKATKKITKKIKKPITKRPFGPERDDLPTDELGKPIELTESLHDFLGRAFVDNYKMPANYKGLVAEAQGYGANIAARFSYLSNKINNSLTKDESKVLFNMLEGDNIFEVKSKTLNELKPEIRDLITEYAQDYVDMGILTPETFLRNQNTYLKRTYSKYKDDPSKFGEELRLRGAYQRVTKQEYEDFYKEQIAFTSTSLTKKPVFELEDVPGKTGQKYLFEDVAGKKQRLEGHRGWELLGSSKKKYDELKPTDEVEMRWEFTKPQRIALGEIEDTAFAIAETGKAFSNTLPRLKLYNDLAKQGYTYTKAEYDNLPLALQQKTVRMPTTKLDPANPESSPRYGNLAGQYVPEEIYKDLTSAHKYYNQTGKWKGYLKLNGLWKISKTAWNPTVHFNNVVTNFVLHDMIDADFKYLKPAFTALMKHNKNNQVSELVELAQKSGVFEADFTKVELKRIQALNLKYPYKYDGDAWESGGRSAKSLFEDIRKNNPLTKLTDFYRFEDHVFRLSVFQDRLAKGMSAAAAGLDARRSFVDYNINAPAINWMRHTATPFLAFTYRMIPILAETAVVRPWKFLKYAALLYSLNSLGDIVGGGDEKAERALMQEKEKGKFIFDFMPYRQVKLPVPQIGDKEFQGPRYIDLTRFAPGGDIFDIGGGTLPFLPAAVQPNFGFGGEVASSLLGIDLFSQRRLRGLGASDYEDAKVKGLDLFKGLIPNIPMLAPGSFSSQRIQSARQGADDPEFRAKETELEALIRSIGLKIQVKDIDKLAALKDLELNRKVGAFRDQIRELNKKFTNGLINERNYEKKLVKLEIKIDNLFEKYDDIFEVYNPSNYRRPLRITEIPGGIFERVKEQTQKLFGKN